MDKEQYDLLLFSRKAVNTPANSNSKDDPRVLLDLAFAYRMLDIARQAYERKR